MEQGYGGVRVKFQLQGPLPSQASPLSVKADASSPYRSGIGSTGNRGQGADLWISAESECIYSFDHGGLIWCVTNKDLGGFIHQV